MKTKLTLRPEEEVIQRAKKSSKEVEKPADLPPIVEALKGSLAGTPLDEEDYRKHLETKHG